MTYTIREEMAIIEIMTQNLNTQGLLNARVTTACSHTHVVNLESNT